MKNIFYVFPISCISILTFLCIVTRENNFNTYSLIAMFFSTLLVFSLETFFEKRNFKLNYVSDEDVSNLKTHEIFALSIGSPFDAFNNQLNAKGYKGVIMWILSLTLLFGITNVFLLTGKIYVDPDSRYIIDSVNIASVLSLVLTQIGGWFFQSVLTYMLAHILGSKRSFDDYLVIVGISYTGYMLLSIFTFLLNYFYVPDGISTIDFGDFIKDSVIHSVSGKAGEYWVLTLVAIGIAKTENFNPIKAILIASIPNFGLLFFKELYSFFII